MLTFKKEKTVDSILTAFNTMVQELVTIQAQKSQEASNIRDEAAALLTKANVADAEAKRAHNVADKLNQIIN
jgi:mevalonate kinase